MCRQNVSFSLNWIVTWDEGAACESEAAAEVAVAEDKVEGENDEENQGAAVVAALMGQLVSEGKLTKISKILEQTLHWTLRSCRLKFQTLAKSLFGCS